MDMALPARARTCAINRPNSDLRQFRRRQPRQRGHAGGDDRRAATVSPDGELVCSVRAGIHRRTYGTRRIRLARARREFAPRQIAARFADGARCGPCGAPAPCHTGPGTRRFGEPPTACRSGFPDLPRRRMRGIRIASSASAPAIVHPVSRWLMVSAAKMAPTARQGRHLARFMAGLGMDGRLSDLPDLASTFRGRRSEAPAGGRCASAWASELQRMAPRRHGRGARLRDLSGKAGSRPVAADRGHQVRLLTGENPTIAPSRASGPRLQTDGWSRRAGSSSNRAPPDLMREIA